VIASRKQRTVSISTTVDGRPKSYTRTLPGASEGDMAAAGLEAAPWCDDPGARARADIIFRSCTVLLLGGCVIGVLCNLIMSPVCLDMISLDLK